MKMHLPPRMAEFIVATARSIHEIIGNPATISIENILNMNFVPLNLLNTRNVDADDAENQYMLRDLLIFLYLHTQECPQ